MMLRPLLSLLVVVAINSGPLAGRAAADDSGELNVAVNGFELPGGDLRFVIFDAKKAFLKRPLLAEVVEGDGQIYGQVDGEAVTWTVNDLASGTYAVQVHHDVDGSGRMERHCYGKPKEPTGTSNNPPPRMGPPQWKKASFEFAAPRLTIEITLN